MSPKTRRDLFRAGAGVALVAALPASAAQASPQRRALAALRASGDARAYEALASDLLQRDPASEDDARLLIELAADFAGRQVACWPWACREAVLRAAAFRAA